MRGQSRDARRRPDRGQPTAGDRLERTPSAELPFWRPLSLTVDPDSGRTALVLFGKASSLTTSCGAQTVDYCFDSSGGFETRALLGGGTAIALPGTLTANLAQLALRNGFVAAATSTSAPLAGGVGTGFPTLSPLSPNAGLVNSSIAVGSKGEAELVIHNGTKLIAYSAAAGGQFRTAVDITSRAPKASPRWRSAATATPWSPGTRAPTTSGPRST